MEMECHLLVAKYKLEQMAVQVKIFEDYSTFSGAVPNIN